MKSVKKNIIIILCIVLLVSPLICLTSLILHKHHAHASDQGQNDCQVCLVLEIELDSFRQIFTLMGGAFSLLAIQCISYKNLAIKTVIRIRKSPVLLKVRMNN